HVLKQSPTRLPKTDTLLSPPVQKSVSIRVEQSDDNTCYLSIPKVTASSSSETLTDITVLSAPCSPSNLSAVTLVGSQHSDNNENREETQPEKSTSMTETTSVMTVRTEVSQMVAPIQEKKVERTTSEEEPSEEIHMLYNQSHRASCSSSRSASISTTAVLQLASRVTTS
ncbi:hypothetical protein AMK59_8074, partial [Oryctes borbonicus]